MPSTATTVLHTTGALLWPVQWSNLMRLLYLCADCSLTLFFTLNYGSPNHTLCQAGVLHITVY
jgi:hypothetical protein